MAAKKTQDLKAFKTSLIKPLCLGSFPRPVFGLTIPEISLPGIIEALAKKDSCATLSLGMRRDPAAPPGGQCPVTHSGTGEPIAQALRAAAKAACDKNVAIELEIDALEIRSEGDAKGRAISGKHLEERATTNELRESMLYNRKAIDEALAMGLARAFILDSTPLFQEGFLTMPRPALDREFQRVFSKRDQLALATRYLTRVFAVAPAGSRNSTDYEFTEEEMMRCALRFSESLKRNREIYQYIRAKTKEPFTIELALNCAKTELSEKEILFYLSEWRMLDAHVDFVSAPVGFQPRADYRGDLRELSARVRRQAAIAKEFGESALALRHGEGTSLKGGKGPKVYDTLATAGRKQIKVRIGDIFFETILASLAKRPAGSAPRMLFERIFDDVETLIRKTVETQAPRADEAMKEHLERYDRELFRGSRSRYDSRAPIFRHYSQAALRYRGEPGSREFASQIIGLCRKDESLREEIDAETQKIAERLIERLGYASSIRRLAASNK